MMRRMSFARGGQEEEEQEINITPMLDVVFIMLIFFIVVATFVKEAGIEIDRPDAQTAEQQDRATIMIAISDDNQVWIDQQEVDVRALRTHIERLHAENPQGSIVIQADQDSSTETLIQVMDAARAAGVLQVAIAAEED